MKTFNLMSTLLALVVVCLFCSFTTVEADFNTCGTIITQGDIMRTQTEEPSNSIEQITLRAIDGTNYSFSGCVNNICDYNIKSLPTGVYQVTIITTYCSFSEAITKR